MSREFIRSARREAAKQGRPSLPVKALPGPLIVSLTSFAPRFPTLHLTLKSLLNQSVTADQILLWIAHHELDLLPAKVRKLEARGLAIRSCEDLGSYKKLIFALEEFPEAYIATADDDMFYEPRWLEGLLSAVDPEQKVIVCHRAHRIRLDHDGRIAPYADWEKKAEDAAARTPSVDLLPTTGAGVLYPPGSLSIEVFDRDKFRSLCPTGDDLWLYWMARREGTKIMKADAAFHYVELPNARVSSLWDINRVGGNDRQIRNLESVFGNPLHFQPYDDEL